MTNPFRIPHSAFRISLFAVPFLSLLLAFFLARAVGNSTIDVGLDLSSPLGQPPRLAWGLAGNEKSPLRIVPPHPRADGSAGILPADGTAGWKPALPNQRWHGRAPRRALAGLRLEPAGLPVPLVRRFYIGALWPVIFTTENLKARPQGLIPKGFQVRDLAPLETGRPLPLPVWTALERGGPLTFGLLFVFLTAFLFLFAAAARAAWRIAPLLFRSPYPECPISAPRPRAALLFFACFVAVWLFYLACFYPAAMTNDSLGQWEQNQLRHWHDYHPALHTLTMWPIVRVWNSPAAVALVQIVLLAAALAWALAFALRLPAPRAAIAAAFATALLSPRNGNMAIVLWKDVWYGVLILLLTVLLARLALDGRWRARPACWVAAGLLLGLVPLYRHNGLLVLAGMTVLLPLGFWPSRRHAILAVWIALAVFGGMRAGLYPALRVYIPPAGEGAAKFLNQRLATLVMQDVPLAPEEAEFLNQVHPLEQSWYTDFNTTDFSRGRRDEYRRLLISFFGRYPLLELDRFRELTDYTWRPWRGPRDLALATSVRIAPNTLGLEQRPLLPALGSRLERLIGALTDARWDWLGWRPAIHLYLALAAAGLLWSRWRNPRLLVIFAPVALNTLSLWLASPSPDYRYQFPLTLCLGFLVCVGLMKRTPT